jgi:hypothetical protein
MTLVGLLARALAWMTMPSLILVAGLVIVCAVPMKWKMSGTVIILWVVAGFAMTGLAVWRVQQWIYCDDLDDLID